MSCAICQENSNDILTFNLPGCKHVLCARCLCGYLKSFTSANISCPLGKCSTLIRSNIIRKCLSNDNLELYDTFCNYANVFKCLTKDCPYYAAVLKQEGCLVCPVCDQPNCLNCSNLHTKYEYCGPSPMKQTYEDNGRINLKNRISTDNRLLLSSKASDCEICSSFSLPREGYVVNPCMHHFCRTCMVKFLKTIQFIDQLKCMCCYVPLKIEDCKQFMDPLDYKCLMMKGMESKVFNCQTPDCNSFWDSEKYKLSHTCTLCQTDNCIPCRAIHQGETCQKFKISEQFLKRSSSLKLAKEQNAINCYNCNVLLVKRDEGQRRKCNALRCNRCGKQLCAYSGKPLGPKGCNCTRNKRCHPTCELGCRPEGKSPEELALWNYWLDN